MESLPPHNENVKEEKVQPRGKSDKNDELQKNLVQEEVPANEAKAQMVVTKQDLKHVISKDPVQVEHTKETTTTMMIIDKQTSDTQKDCADDDESVLDEDDWKAEMTDILNGIDNKGEYYTAKNVTHFIPQFSPKLHIHGMDPGEQVTFPLQNFQARRLRSLAEKAPFGSGLKTVLDESVRKAWQIDASNVSFGNPDESSQWQSVLYQISMDCVASLGLTEYQRSNVHANLYKVLLYEPGGHFQTHKDTEKEPGMFATLTLQLPAKFSGGALVIRHKGETQTVDFSEASDAGFYATAFYADCEHELLPVTEGWRLCLVYNLVLRPKSTTMVQQVLTASLLTSQTENVRRLVKHWEDSFGGQDALGYLLEHSYTATNLHFSNLKGRDKEVVDFLSGARDTDGNPLFTVCLMLAEKREMGEPEVEHRSYYNRYDDSDDGDDGNHAMGEIFETETGISHWVGPNDKVISNFNQNFSLEDDLLTDEDVDELFGEDPSKQDYEGYTGNAGPTLEYWYYRGVVVFWPRGAINMRVVKSAGIPYMLSYMSVALPSEVLEISDRIVNLLEKGQLKLSSDILEGLLRAKNEVSIIKALKSCDYLLDEPFAKLLVKVIETMKSEKVSNQALEIVEKTLLAQKKTSSSYHYNAKDSLSMSLAFLDDLNQRNLLSILKVAREKVVFRAMENDVVVMKSTKLAKLAEVAFVAGIRTFQAFHDKVAMMGGSFEKLRSILENLFALGADAVKHPLVINLANIRAKQLLLDTMDGVPRFSWRQPNANFVGSHRFQVHSFLHSDEQSVTILDFNGISHARNWASKYFGYGVQNGYSARADAGGRGQGAFVTLTKTKGVHEETGQLYISKKQELAVLKKIVGDALDVRISSENKRSQFSCSGPTAKKPRDEDIIVID